MDERGENEWQSENEDEMNRKLDQGAREPTGVGANWLRRKGLIKEEGFEIRVKLMRGEGKKKSRIIWIAEWLMHQGLPELSEYMAAGIHRKIDSFAKFVETISRR